MPLVMDPIKIFTTGGTIDKVYFDRKDRYEIGESQVDRILREANVTFAYAMESILRKDSLDMTEEDRRRIVETVRTDPCRRIVVTHGTDTMVATAQALQAVPGKVIVLTGALTPARFRESDAVFNIASAVMAVQWLADGVYIVMNGRVFRPDNVRKNVEQNRFETLRATGD